MGWFDEQIKQRKSRDDEEFSEVMAQLSDTITRKKTATEADENAKIRSAIDIILRYYHCKPKEIPDRITDLDKQLEFACRPYGIMRREVNLESGWYRDAVGAMLGRKKDGTPVALIPNKTWGYSIVENGKRTRLNKRTEKLLDSEAYCFYKPFPMKK
ncbi:MAG: NHLP family bacteriocin export ABC transporter permease/ATPase subunit, partial [Ruminiclostridium sp.]